MVSLGLLDRSQVAQVLDLLRERQRGRFGELALELGFVDEAGLAQAVAAQFGLPVLHDGQVQALSPGADLVELLSPSFMRRERVVPTFLDAELGVLSLITADPSDLPTLESARQRARARQVRLFVGTRSSISSLLQRVLSSRDYGDDDSVSTSLLAPTSGGTVVFEPDPARLSALRRLQTVDGGQAQLVSDPEQVTAVLEDGGAWRVVFRRAVRQGAEPFRSVWSRMRPGLRVVMVEGYGPDRSGPTDALAEAWLTEARGRMLQDHSAGVGFELANRRVRAIADALGISDVRARALTWVDLHLRLARPVPERQGLSELVRALEDRKHKDVHGPDLGVELLLCEHGAVDQVVHPAVIQAAFRVDRRARTAVKLAEGQNVEVPAEDLPHLLQLLIEHGSHVQLQVSGTAQVGRLSVADGHLVSCELGQTTGVDALLELLTRRQGRVSVRHEPLDGPPKGPLLSDLL
jgi:hypothetical protein